MDLGLAGKKSLVAGGGRGIGKAIARELAREGADVVIVSRTLEELERSAQEIAEETGQSVTAMAVDVTDRAQVDRVVAAAAERMGGLHILVNSASLPGGSASAIGPIDTVNEDDLISDFDVKYAGALRCARAAIPFMKEHGWGRIVNISGGNGRTAGNLSGGAAQRRHGPPDQDSLQPDGAGSASRSIASTPAPPAPNALPECWRPGLPSWV